MRWERRIQRAEQAAADDPGDPPAELDPRELLAGLDAADAAFAEACARELGDPRFLLMAPREWADLATEAEVTDDPDVVRFGAILARLTEERTEREWRALPQMSEAEHDVWQAFEAADFPPSVPVPPELREGETLSIAVYMSEIRPPGLTARQFWRDMQ